jgi:hypothetical protein
VTVASQPDAPEASGPARPFAHLNAPLHALYRGIMTVFRDSKQRFVVHLRPEDVAEALWAAGGPGAPRVSQEEITEALGKLEEWGNLRATPDTSRVTTVEDFYRTRYLYQLTREGEARREAADVAPGAQADASGAAMSSAQAKLMVWRNRWSGVWSWFCGDRVHPSQATLLRQRARKAIPDLLATISVLQERRAGRSDRSADFRTLARWFAQASSEDDAHRLWRAAFGLSSARHFTGEPPGSSGRSAGAESWLDAEPLVVTPRLRATGRYERRGGPARVRDRAAEREHLARQIAAERDQAEAARRRLADGHAAKLSEFGELDLAEFRLFLRILREALSAGPPGPGGTIVARTGDGTMEITLRPLPSGIAEIITPDGVLRGPDHEITITDLTAPLPPSPVQAASAGTPSQMTAGWEGTSW